MTDDRDGVNIPLSNFDHDDEIDLKELWRILWSGRWVIFVFSLVFACAGVVFALMKPNIYEASVLVAPAQNEGNAPKLANQIGGLATLAGISLGQQSGSKTILAREILHSRAFVTKFIHRHNLTKQIAAAKKWDEEGEQWIFSEEIINPETGEWMLDDMGQSLQPTDWELVKIFMGSHLFIRENKDTGMLTVVVRSVSPMASKQWAQWLVEDINEHMRKLDIETAERRIGYLEKKLDQVDIAGMQQVFYQLIENEMRTVMLANAQKEYVFQVVDPAVVPQEKVAPKRSMICILAILLGGLVGVVWVLVKGYLLKEKAANI